MQIHHLDEAAPAISRLRRIHATISHLLSPVPKAAKSSFSKNKSKGLSGILKLGYDVHMYKQNKWILEKMDYNWILKSM